MQKPTQTLFAQISKRYDITNDVLSLGIHRYWRYRATKSISLQGTERVLDVCTGTGDFAFSFTKRTPHPAHIVGVDFSPAMIALAKQKQATRKLAAGIDFREGDATALPFSDDSFDVVSIGFGIRNIPDTSKAFSEIRRVLKPNGTLIILEFGGLPEIWILSFYLKRVLPIIGGLVSGNRAAYHYLQETSQAFPSGKRFGEILNEHGFPTVTIKRHLWGTAWRYTARKT